MPLPQPHIGESQGLGPFQKYAFPNKQSPGSPLQFTAPENHFVPAPSFESQMQNQSLTDWRLLIRALRTPEVPLTTFTGFDHEDPNAFLNECEEFFTQAAIDPSQWTRMINKSLKEPASKWWEVYKSLNLPWAKFRDMLIQRFAGTTTIMRLHAKLYSSKQQEKESVGVFLQQKYLLALRLQPEMPEASTLSLLLESLRPSLRNVLRAANIESFGDLLERAIQAEADEAEETPRRDALDGARTKPPTTPASPENNNPEFPPQAPRRAFPQCHYCPERHYHAHCPVLHPDPNANQGNWRARAEEANAPPATANPSAPPS